MDLTLNTLVVPYRNSSVLPTYGKQTALLRKRLGLLRFPQAYWRSSNYISRKFNLFGLLDLERGSLGEFGTALPEFERH